MYTSNFSKSAADPRAVSIARRAPPWYTGPSYLDLAPTEELLNHWHMYHDQQHYLIEFQKQLDKLDPLKVLNDLGPDAVLCCWEAPDVFCHRFIIARWLEYHCGIVISEIPKRFKVGVPPC